MPETLPPGVTEADVSFFCPGIPQPGGSKRAFAHKTTGRIVVTEDCRRSKEWRAVVALAAQAAMGGMPPLAGPLAVSITFTLSRPKGHYGTGRNARTVRAGAPRYPTVKPDTTKLLRAAEDSLKGICWLDDAQIVRQHAGKEYGEAPGVWIEIRRLAAGEDAA